jgi:cyclohexyl-isocyanide hydratase
MSSPLFVSERSGPQITTRPLSVGCLIFPRMDQIDFTGPFEVLSRMPDTTVTVVGKELGPIRDVQGLRLTADARIADAGAFDVLLVPGGYGQQALMHDAEVFELIRRHAQPERLLFSACTGALLCGAAGVLKGRQMTTHWSARHLMSYYGADLADARVVVDGNIISAAGVTAGLDGALVLVSILRGDVAAQEIQLAIEYAPNPVFHSGTPENAPAEVLQSFQRKYEPIGTARQAEAIRYAKLLWPVRDCRGTKSPLGAKSAPQGGVVMMSHNKKSDNPASRDQVPNYTKLRAGDQDRQDPIEQHKREVLPRIRGAELKVIEDCGHLIPIDQPARLADEIQAFVLSRVIGKEAARDSRPLW